MWNEWNARTRKNWWQRRVQGWRKFWNLTTLAVFCVVYQTTSIHFFPLGFPTFFFFKSTGPKSEYKRNWRNSDKLPSKAGETAAFETSRSDAPDPKENAGSLSRWLAPRRRLKSAACLFFVSSLFCSSYLHISTIKKNELHGFSASFFSQYPCLYRHVCTGDALHSTTCDLVDRCWPHFLLFSLAHPNQNDQPMSNL